VVASAICPHAARIDADLYDDWRWTSRERSSLVVPSNDCAWQALANASAGSGALFVVEGPAGIRKSALLDHVIGLQPTEVLRSAGRELEMHHPFAVVHQLFDRLLATASASEREEWFAGAADLAASVLVGGRRSGASLRHSTEDLFGSLYGLYWFVVSVSDRGPVVLVIDDAHWADEPSLAFVSYLSRRLSDLPVSLIVGTRPPEEAPTR
jgi:hypothetical protein